MIKHNTNCTCLEWHRPGKCILSFCNVNALCLIQFCKLPNIAGMNIKRRCKCAALSMMKISAPKNSNTYCLHIYMQRKGGVCIVEVDIPYNRHSSRINISIQWTNAQYGTGWRIKFMVRTAHVSLTIATCLVRCDTKSLIWRLRRRREINVWKKMQNILILANNQLITNASSLQ